MSIPQLIITSPLDNAIGYELTAGKLDIVFTFDQNMFNGSGKMYLCDYFSDEIVDSIDAGSLTISVFDRTKVTWSSATAGVSQFYVLADTGVVNGSTDNWPGISDKTTFNFGTKGAPPVPDGSTVLSRDFPSESQL